MKGLKKIAAVLFAIAMMLGMTSAAWAEDHKPVATDTVKATVTNVEEDVTVTAYHIVVGNYSDDGLVGYKLAEGLTTSDIAAANLQPTSDEIAALAANKASSITDKKVLSYDSENEEYYADLEAGYWMILVTGADETVYNPMLLGVYYSTEKSGDLNDLVAEAATVSAADNWELVTTDAYAKSTTPETTKEIVTNSDGDPKTNKGDDHNLKEFVSFKVTTEIPSYSAEYDTVTFKVKDELDPGLDYLKGVCTGSDHAEPTGGHTLVVKVGGEVIDTTDTTIVKSLTETTGAGGGFELEFASGYILGLADNDASERAVEITYDAKLNENCKTNLDPNKNTVTVEYSNNPSDSTSTHEEEDETFHYTFEIDGKAFGSSEENNKDVYKSGPEETDSTFHKYGLDGAEFTLYTDAECTEALMTATTKDAGQMNFKGLDEGVYYLKETKAPKGYSLNSAVHKVTIAAEFYEADDAENGIKKGMLKNYSISFEEVGADPAHTSSKTYVAEYDNDGSLDTENINIHNDDEGYEIADTKIPELPSTGGTGTYAMTIIGVAIFALAALMMMKERRRA